MPNPIYFLLLIISLSLHEFAHAWMADRLGDPTPRSQGRLTINPLAHLDPLGTFCMLLFRFGWGKPVQIDPYNFSNPKRDELLVAAAGPISNLILAILSSLLIHLVPSNIFINLLTNFVYINLLLAVFNLLPLWPLDGSKILVNLLPEEANYNLKYFLQTYSTPILLLFLLPLFGSTSLINNLIIPPIDFLAKLLLF